jgi:GxxExxY protein
MEENMKFADLTRKIIGCGMKVHNYFGPGYPENIYQKSLLIEFRKAGILYRSELVKDIYYEGELVGKRRLDIIAEDKVIVELKAISELDEGCTNKILNYLKVFNQEVGLLLNFGCKSLQYKRFVN